MVNKVEYIESYLATDPHFLKPGCRLGHCCQTTAQPSMAWAVGCERNWVVNRYATMVLDPTV